jgi:hypothetical protein
MANMLSTLLNDDFVWSSIMDGVRLLRTRSGSAGATNINCPMCVRRGESTDTRFRCGIWKNGDGLGVHCFNCGFKTKFVTGQPISKSLAEFMEGIGIASLDVMRLNHKAMQHSRMLSMSGEAQAIIPSLATFRPNFPTVVLPKDALPLAEWAKHELDDPNFLAACDYLFSRGEAIASSMEFYWSPSTEYDMNHRLIIPFTYEGRIVGYTGRLVDGDGVKGKRAKYWSSAPHHYLFNYEVLRSNNKIIPLVEGPFDALAINGVATLGAKLSIEQARWLTSSGKTIIVVPDRDKSGGRLIDAALEHGWMVAFPRLRDGSGTNNWWDVDVKDCAKASERYGKLYTVRSIIETVASNKIEINVKKKLLF